MKRKRAKKAKRQKKRKKRSNDLAPQKGAFSFILVFDAGETRNPAALPCAF